MVDGVRSKPRAVPNPASAPAAPARPAAGGADGGETAAQRAVDALARSAPLAADVSARVKELLASEVVVDVGTRVVPDAALKSVDLKTWTPNELRRALHEDLLRCFGLLSKLPPAVVFFGGARIKPGDSCYDAARELGERLARIGRAVRTGAGPGIMAAGPEGQKRVEGVLTQGIRISLPFEQEWSEHIDAGVEALLFAFRKLFLYDDSPAVLTWPGGYGTLDELFEVWAGCASGRMQKDLAVYEAAYWEPILDALKGALVGRGFVDEADFARMEVLDDVDAAVKWSKDAFASNPAPKMGSKRVAKLAREMDESITLLDRLEPAVVFLGGRKLSAKDPELTTAHDVARKVAEAGAAVRVGATGVVAEAVGKGVRAVDPKREVQGVLLEGEPGESRFVPNLRVHQSTLEPVVHKEVVGRRAKAVVALPGGLNTLGELFAILTQIQVGHLPQVPVVLVGKEFWTPIVEAFKAQMLNQQRQTISPHDLDLFTIVDDAEEAARIALSGPPTASTWTEATASREGVVFEGVAKMTTTAGPELSPWLHGGVVGPARLLAPFVDADPAGSRARVDGALSAEAKRALDERGVDPGLVARALEVGAPPADVERLLRDGAGAAAFEFLFHVEPYAGQRTPFEVARAVLARWGPASDVVFDRLSYLCRAEGLMNPDALKTWMTGISGDGGAGDGFATMVLDACDLLAAGHRIYVEEHPEGNGDVVDATAKVVYQHKRVSSGRLKENLKHACAQLAGSANARGAPPGYQGVVQLDLRANPRFASLTDAQLADRVASMSVDASRLDRVQLLLDDRVLFFDRSLKLVHVKRTEP